jgi:uncharacterized protein (DUF1800 family)
MVIDDRRRIAHLLRRAGFGASPAEREEYLALGFEASVDRLLHPETIPDDGALDREFDALVADAELQKGMTTLRWLYRMTHSPRPLEEKLAFFWHDHFATSVEKVKSEAQMWRQYELFRSRGLGRFEELTVEVARDPAMLFWLDNWQSHKEAPNENFGRELLELFTLGIGNYSEADVKAASRAFTGWTLDVWGERAQQGETAANEDLTEEERQALKKMMMMELRDNAAFLFWPVWHDESEKTFLGQTGNWNGEDIVRIATGDPACARFVAGKLFAFFVWDQPDKATVAPYAAVFTETGGDIRETLRAIFLSADFVSDRAYRAKVKSPVEFVVGAMRGLGGWLGARQLLGVLQSMGQVPFAPPHVGGWPSGLAWAGPSAAFARVNLINALLGGTARAGGRAGAVTPIDLAALFDGNLPSTAEDAVAVAVDQVLEGDATDEQTTALTDYLTLGAAGQVELFGPDSASYEAKLAGLIRLATATPAYLLN